MDEDTFMLEQPSSKFNGELVKDMYLFMRGKETYHYYSF